MKRPIRTVCLAALTGGILGAGGTWLWARVDCALEVKADQTALAIKATQLEVKSQDCAHELAKAAAAREASASKLDELLICERNVKDVYERLQLCQQELRTDEAQLQALRKGWQTRQ